MWGGGGQQDGYPSHPPLPQLAELSPKSGRIAISHHVAGATGNTKCPPTVAKGLRVTRSVREVCAKESCEQCGVG
jgi:hypothetical protein